MIRSAAPLQEYGEQFSCTVKRRRVQQDLIAARQEANRYAEMARAATVTAEGMNRSFTMKSKLGVGTTVTIQFPADRVEHASHEPQNAETAHEMVS